MSGQPLFARLAAVLMYLCAADHRRDVVLLGHLASVVLPDLLREVNPSKDAYREGLGNLGRDRDRDLGPRIHYRRGQ